MCSNISFRMIASSALPVVTPVVRALSLLNERVCSCWISANRWIVNSFRNCGFLKLGVGLGMVLTESHVLIKAAWHTKRKYAKEPAEYGFNMAHNNGRPVLLFHGAVGSWNYLGDLATDLKKAKFDVFVTNIPAGLSSDEKRRLAVAKITEIQKIYTDTVGRAPKVDLVAHSMGAFTALQTAFSEESTSITENDELKLKAGSTWTANPQIGKIVTLAMPSDAKEVAYMERIGKVGELFNINAQYDALMGHKRCALVEERSKQAVELDAGHVGIVFKRDTFTQIKQFLS